MQRAVPLSSGTSNDTARQIRINISHVSKSFWNKGRRVDALHDITLDIRDGEFVCLLGKSGCGKSTLLHMVAGLEPTTSGQVHLDGRPIDRPTPQIGVVFQKFSLFPWLNVEQNIGFPLECRGMGHLRRHKVAELIELVGLQGFERAMPSQLSGGMAQRVSLARTLAFEPEVILFDEPFGALDAFTRMNMQEEIARIWQQKRFTALFVTHDIDEAIFLGTSVIIMSPQPGRIERVLEIDLSHPRDRTLPGFIHFREEAFRQFHLVREQPGYYVI